MTIRELKKNIKQCINVLETRKNELLNIEDLTPRICGELTIIETQMAVYKDIIKEMEM